MSFTDCGDGWGGVRTPRRWAAGGRRGRAHPAGGVARPGPALAWRSRDPATAQAAPHLHARLPAPQKLRHVALAQFGRPRLGACPRDSWRGDSTERCRRFAESRCAAPRERASPARSAKGCPVGRALRPVTSPRGAAERADRSWTDSERGHQGKGRPGSSRPVKKQGTVPSRDKCALARQVYAGWLLLLV